jgi:hypothetical protein
LRISKYSSDISYVPSSLEISSSPRYTLSKTYLKHLPNGFVCATNWLQNQCLSFGKIITATIFISQCHARGRRSFCKALIAMLPGIHATPSPEVQSHRSMSYASHIPMTPSYRTMKIVPSMQHTIPNRCHNLVLSRLCVSCQLLFTVY